MSFSRVYSAQTHLLKGKIVTVEVDITKKTLHAFTLVGLPDKAVDESKDRMSSALSSASSIFVSMPYSLSSVLRDTRTFSMLSGSAVTGRASCCSCLLLCEGHQK